MVKIVMNGIQRKARKEFLEKLDQGKYKKIAKHCLCGGEYSLLIGKRDRYRLPLRTVLCMSCGLVRSDPYYDEETLESFYKGEYRRLYSSSEEPLEDFFDNQIHIGQNIIKYLESTGNTIQGKKVFEIGCGAGGILKAFQEKGAKVYGCDFGQDYLTLGKKRGINLVEGDSDSLKKFGKAEIIILNHVLEHFLYPENELKKINSLLEDSGLLYISVPGLVMHYKTYGSLRKYLQNAHVYSFTLKSLEFLLGRVGFYKIAGDEKIRAIFLKGRRNVKSLAFIYRYFLYIYLRLSYLL